MGNSNQVSLKDLGIEVKEDFTAEDYFDLTTKL